MNEQEETINGNDENIEKKHYENLKKCGANLIQRLTEPQLDFICEIIEIWYAWHKSKLLKEIGEKELKDVIVEDLKGMIETYGEHKDHVYSSEDAIQMIDYIIIHTRPHTLGDYAKI